MNDSNKEAIFKLKKELENIENELIKYKELLDNIEYNKNSKKNIDIICYIVNVLISIGFGINISFLAFIITFLFLTSIQKIVLFTIFDTKKETEEKKKYIRAKRKEYREQKENLENKIYFLENTKANNNDIKQDEKIISIEDYSNDKDKNKIKKLIQPN